MHKVKGEELQDHRAPHQLFPCLLPPFGQWELISRGMFGAVYHPAAVKQRARQNRQGTQLLWLLTKFGNDQSAASVKINTR